MKEVDEQYRKEENIVSINEIKNLITLYDIKKMNHYLLLWDLRKIQLHVI